MRNPTLEKNINMLNDAEQETSFDNINSEIDKNKKDVQTLNEFNGEFNKSKKFAHNEDERMLLLKESK